MPIPSKGYFRYPKLETNHMQPPILTKRQKQILELMFFGASREEIASHIGISPETVKLHTRKTLEKFDAVNLRDGFSEISRYLNFFGETGLGYTSYLNQVTMKTTIDESGKTARVYRKTTGVVINGPLMEHVMSLSGQGDRNYDITFCGVTPEFQNSSNGILLCRIPVIPPLTDGETFVREFEYSIEFAPDKLWKNFNYVIGSPVGQMDINIEFLGRLPEQINLLSQKGVAITTMDEDKNVHTEIGDHSISLRIQNPVSETRYIVEWV
jgi:DNA-binding CsgD family transcriptional regulator